MLTHGWLVCGLLCGQSSLEAPSPLLSSEAAPSMTTAVEPSAPSQVVAPEARSRVHGALHQPPPQGETQPRRAKLRRYLSRATMTSGRFLDHGVLMIGGAGGWPHRYRLTLALGVLDHLTIGLTSHWLPGQRAPQVAPVIALAFYRSRHLELGAVYHASLFPPPARDLDIATPDFAQRADWILGSVALSQGWLAGGFEFGVVRARERDHDAVPPGDGSTPSRIRVRPGGGLHLRAGTRRWGFTALALAPHLYAELMFDLRFGVFELRPRGGWRPSGLVGWSDRKRGRR